MSRMTRPIVASIALCAALFLLADTLHACSTFCVHAGGRRLFGRNYDFEIGDGMVTVNPSGLRKRGFQAGGPKWTSRFGSVTFNQFGREYPTGGMNQAALVVELMWLDEAQYPPADARMPVGVLEWIQYQLDTAATVDAVIESDRQVRISGRVPLHYLVSDSSGRAATIEFLHGRLVVHTAESLPVPVLTNSAYKDSLRYLESRGGRAPSGAGSLERFARAAMGLERLEASGAARPIGAVFELLAGVAQRNTRWSIVYDQTARAIHFRTDVFRPLRFVTMDAFSFACREGARLLDVDTPIEGNVSTKFKAYSTAANLAFITRTYAASSVTRLTPAAEIAAIAAHPDTATCER